VRCRCPIRRSLGVYVLDAIDPAERDAMERHLRGCGECRRELERFAALPELLAGVPVAEAELMAPPPPALLDRLLEEARAVPRPPRRGMVAALSVALLLVLAVGVGLGRDALRAAPTPTTFSAWNAATDGRMAAEVTPLPFGSGVELRLDGVRPGERCRLIARGAGDRAEVLARWRATYAGTAGVHATTSIPAADLSELSVVAADGRLLTSVSIP
jgi:hypothetical protein